MAKRKKVEALERVTRERDDTVRALHEKCEGCEVGRGLQARAEKAERERDEAHEALRLCVEQLEMCGHLNENDEARVNRCDYCQEAYDAARKVVGT